MSELMSTSLDGKVEDVGGLHFLRAEWWTPGSRFVVIRCALDDSASEIGLRMDMDKRVFLDQLENEALNERVVRHASDVWDVVAREKPTIERQLTRAESA